MTEDSDQLGLVANIFHGFLSQGIVKSYSRDSLMHVSPVKNVPFFTIFRLDTEESPLLAFSFDLRGESESGYTIAERFTEFIYFSVCFPYILIADTCS